MNFEDLSGNQLVELFGAEMMGRSFLRRMASRTVKSVKKAGGVVARNAGNIAVIASVPATGGLSLLAKKSVRDGVGTAARFSQRKIIRPVSHQVANVARNPALQSALVHAASSFVPGGSAAFSALDLLKSKARSAASPFVSAARTIQNAAAKPASAATIRKPHAKARIGPAGPAAKPASAATIRKPHAKARIGPAAPAAHAGLSMPLMLGIGGVGLAGLLLAVSMGKKKG